MRATGYLFSTLGLMMTVIGACAADSQPIKVPMTFIFIGLLLMVLGAMAADLAGEAE